MKKRRYISSAWKEERPDSFWSDCEKRKWYEFFNKTVVFILEELKLEKNETAKALAKNLWYYGNADEKMIRQQLEMYKLSIA